MGGITDNVVELTILIAFAVPSVEDLLVNRSGRLLHPLLCATWRLLSENQSKGMPSSTGGVYEKIVAVILIPLGLGLGLWSLVETVRDTGVVDHVIGRHHPQVGAPPRAPPNPPFGDARL